MQDATCHDVPARLTALVRPAGRCRSARPVRRRSRASPAPEGGRTPRAGWSSAVSGTRRDAGSAPGSQRPPGPAASSPVQASTRPGSRRRARARAGTARREHAAPHRGQQRVALTVPEQVDTGPPGAVARDSPTDASESLSSSTYWSPSGLGAPSIAACAPTARISLRTCSRTLRTALSETGYASTSTDHRDPASDAITRSRAAAPVSASIPAGAGIPSAMPPSGHDDASSPASSRSAAA